MLITSDSLSIYVHIPFCVRKCLYCDFLSFNCGQRDIDEYFRALLTEVKEVSADYKNIQVKSIFFGGGTPSFVDAEHICDTLQCIRENFDVAPEAEISIECNPASAIYDKLRAYRVAGINRISIGAQSLNDEELTQIGRAHNAAMFYETFDNARRAGFDNINVDIMSTLPGQSMESYMETLRKVVELNPEHISAYSLIVEEGTPFYEMELDLPDEDEDRRMYHETKRFLAEHGYHRYEISNYARDHVDTSIVNASDNADGYECYHNKVYWKRGNYLGLGLGASSMVKNIRWKNTSDMNQYIQGVEEETNREAMNIAGSDVGKISGIRQEIQNLTPNECMEEFMFLGLRLTRGVSCSDFMAEFGQDIYEVYGKIIDKYIADGLLVRSGDNIFLSDEGMDVSNTVMADFLLD